MTTRLTLWLLFIVASCKKDNTQADTKVPFEAIPVIKAVQPMLLDEASGIADSKINPGFLWVEQDSGNPNEIALFSHDALTLKKIGIKAIVNRDWEDMALANGPTDGKKFIYLADIGDNAIAAQRYDIYRFEEPVANIDSVKNFDRINFQYPDGSHDAEAILVDPVSKDIYVITKSDNPAKLYKLAYPQSTTAVNNASFIGQLAIKTVTSAAISDDGNEILARNYETIYYWKRRNGESIIELLTSTPQQLSSQFEPQGEALCFLNDGSGYFSLSERPPVIGHVNLNRYNRK